MNDLDHKADLDVDSHQATAAYEKLAPPVVATPPRRCLALVPGTTSHVAEELHLLLRKRLRVAGLIALAGFAVFLIKGLLSPSPVHGHQPIDLAVHAVVVAVMTVLCSLLWSRLPFGMRGLRVIEIT